MRSTAGTRLDPPAHRTAFPTRDSRRQITRFPISSRVRINFSKPGSRRLATRPRQLITACLCIPACGRCLQRTAATPVKLASGTRRSVSPRSIPITIPVLRRLASQSLHSHETVFSSLRRNPSPANKYSFLFKRYPMAEPRDPAAGNCSKRCRK